MSSSGGLRASVAITPATGVVTSAYPVADIAYILLAVGSYLDTTGRFKYTADISGISDFASLSTTKAADADAFALSDDTTLSAIKGLSDTAVMSDSLLAILIFLRDFQDTASLADAKALLISSPYSDTIAVSDTSFRSMGKTVADSFSLNDLSDAAGPTFSFADFTNNTVLALDSPAIGNSKALSDLLSLADSGTVSVQDYCNLTYFAEGYVGEARSF